MFCSRSQTTAGLHQWDSTANNVMETETNSQESRVSTRTESTLCETEPFLISTFLKTKGETSIVLEISGYQKCYPVMNSADFKRHFSLCWTSRTTADQTATAFLWGHSDPNPILSATFPSKFKRKIKLKKKKTKETGSINKPTHKFQEIFVFMCLLEEPMKSKQMKCHFVTNFLHLPSCKCLSPLVVTNLPKPFRNQGKQANCSYATFCETAKGGTCYRRQETRCVTTCAWESSRPPGTSTANPKQIPIKNGANRTLPRVTSQTYSSRHLKALPKCYGY